MASEAPLIVLVDDDPDFLEINARVLEAEGYRVLSFSNPQDALEGMGEEKPQLVITDLMMQALHAGFSFARQIKEDARFGDVPVIIVTAVGSRLGLDFNPSTPGDLAAMRAEAYFEKPVSPQALLAKAGELVQRGAEEDQP